MRIFDEFILVIIIIITNTFLVFECKKECTGIDIILICFIFLLYFFTNKFLEKIGLGSFFFLLRAQNT